MLNWIWLGLILFSVVYAAFTGNMAAVTKAVTDDAKAAVNLVIGLVGLMVFWLGVMRIAFDGGLRDAIARWLAPLLRRLFPDVPADHPAMGAMVMNMASNILGLGNAATPFGLKAMSELAKLNRHPGSASNAMVLFLAINTSSITLLPPLGTVAIRSAAGSADPFAIWIPTLIATTCSTIGAVAMFFLLRKLPRFSHRAPGGTDAVAEEALAPDPELEALEIPGAGPPRSASRGKAMLAGATAAVLALGFGLEVARLIGEGFDFRDILKQVAEAWMVPILLSALLLYGFAKGVRVYESAIEGAKEGLEVAVRIVPYLVAILVAVGVFRASGALDQLLIPLVQPVTSLIGVPGEVLPMALIRPLSGSGALGVMSEIVTTNGPDSFVGQLTCTLMGSTETTFYVLAVYLGAARVREGRHTLPACLTGDLCGFLGATAACHWFFG